jgi:hypothetical protein
MWLVVRPDGHPLIPNTDGTGGLLLAALPPPSPGAQPPPPRPPSQHTRIC